MIRTISKSKKIIFEKGDTIGGTAPLLLMNQIKGGRDARFITNRRGRKKGAGLGAWLSSIISVFVLIGLIAAGFNMFDWSDELIRFQGIFSSLK